jgi:hypothetical protein
MVNLVNCRTTEVPSSAVTLTLGKANFNEYLDVVKGNRGQTCPVARLVNSKLNDKFHCATGGTALFLLPSDKEITLSVNNEGVYFLIDMPKSVQQWIENFDYWWYMYDYRDLAMQKVDLADKMLEFEEVVNIPRFCLPENTV